MTLDPKALEGAGVRVARLAWVEISAPREDGPREPTGEFEALCVFGAYSVAIDADEDMSAYPFCVWSPEDNLGHCASADEAKAAAQADYEARILAALEPLSALPQEREAVTDDYDRGRRDMLNALLALNPKAAQKRHIINGGSEETFHNAEGKLPFDVVFWVCEVADQLGIEPKDAGGEQP